MRPELEILPGRTYRFGGHDRFVIAVEIAHYEGAAAGPAPMVHYEVRNAAPSRKAANSYRNGQRHRCLLGVFRHHCRGPA